VLPTARRWDKRFYVADDERMYERSAIEQWLRNRSTSPMDPSCTLRLDRLMASRKTRETIEALVESGDISAGVKAAWHDRKRALDLVKARKMYDEGRVLDAAKLGLPKAQAKVAKWYLRGTNGMEKDDDKLAEWATKAAEGGDADEQFRLGYANNHGKGVEKDWVKARHWYEVSAAQGLISAMNNLGTMHQCGQGGEKDLAKAVEWFRKAAEAGSRSAQNHLGVCYLKGRGVEANPTTAREWFEKSAAQDNMRGQLNLGKMMIKVEGGPSKVGQGYVLLEKAAEAGSDEAKRLITAGVVALV
jgi:TPR repeat protein